MGPVIPLIFVLFRISHFIGFGRLGFLMIKDGPLADPDELTTMRASSFDRHSYHLLLCQQALIGRILIWVWLISQVTQDRTLLTDLMPAPAIET